MIFHWIKRRRRKKILAQPFPEEWEPILQRNVRHYGWLDEADRAKLRRAVQIFVAETYWEGCGGLTITTEMQVTIAGHACLLVLGFEDDYFDRLQTVLVYPDAYIARQEEINSAGVVSVDLCPRLGETWSRGPVILAWDSVQAAGTAQDRGNVVLHEFAHFLDVQDEGFDGTPPLRSPEQYRVWNEVMSAEYEQLVRQSERGRATLLDDYGAQNEAEFFAVATECFFEQPAAMQRLHPHLYQLLADFYRQDPAGRERRAKGEG
jgi:MtfA peptidase